MATPVSPTADASASEENLFDTSNIDRTRKNIRLSSSTINRRIATFCLYITQCFYYFLKRERKHEKEF